jgi:hypothetical protein
VETAFEGVLEEASEVAVGGPLRPLWRA